MYCCQCCMIWWSESSSCHFYIWSILLVCAFVDSLSIGSSQLLPPATVEEEEEELEEEHLNDLTTIVSEEVIQEADIAPPPQTDILPWVASTVNTNCSLDCLQFYRIYTLLMMLFEYVVCAYVQQFLGRNGFTLLKHTVLVKVNNSFASHMHPQGGTDLCFCSRQPETSILRDHGHRASVSRGMSVYCTAKGGTYLLTPEGWKVESTR